MEVVGFFKEMLRNVAEYVASYRLGQTALRSVDRVLWTIEKSARWAVPPPLDQDERPQPELIRPLPWIFFLPLLIILRVTRESISLLNLALGKPPLRSADMVIYIQGKRRYLRTLKYQGNRMMRARTFPQTNDSWYSSLQTLLDFTMCFRRPSRNYGNNNTTSISNNDEVLVVKLNKHGQQEADTLPSTCESTMERLIEKMMVDIQMDSDDDSSYTLTNPKSNQTETSTESERDERLIHNDIPAPNKSILSESKYDYDKTTANVVNTTEMSTELNRKHSENELIKKTEGTSQSSEGTVVKLSKRSMSQTDEVSLSIEETRRLIQNEKSKMQKYNSPQTPKRKKNVVNGRTKSASSKKESQS